MVLVSGGVNAHLMKSIREFGQANESIVVDIKSLDQMDSVVLQTGMVFSAFFNLGEDVLNRGLREVIWVVFHVLLGVLIS